MKLDSIKMKLGYRGRWNLNLQKDETWPYRKAYRGQEKKNTTTSWTTLRDGVTLRPPGWGEQGVRWRKLYRNTTIKCVHKNLSDVGFDVMWKSVGLSRAHLLQLIYGSTGEIIVRSCGHDWWHRRRPQSAPHNNTGSKLWARLSSVYDSF